MPRDAVAFLFSSQGGQWPGMGSALFRREPLFRSAISRCDEVIGEMLSWSLVEELSRAPGAWEVHTLGDRIQPALTALQIALSDLLRARGVEPRATIGLSMGEVAAAHAAGALEVRDAMRIVCTQARLARRSLRPGRMVIAALTPETARQHLEGEPDVAIAVELAPTVSVLSGERDAVGRIVDRLVRAGVRVGDVPVGSAFHSREMASLRDAFVAPLRGLAPCVSRIPFYSAAVGGRADGASLDARHWWLIMSAGARFVDAVRAAIADGARAFIEIGPGATLVESVRAIASDLGRSVPILPTMLAEDRSDEALRMVLSTRWDSPGAAETGCGAAAG